MRYIKTKIFAGLTLVSLYTPIDAISGDFNLDSTIDGATAGNADLTLEGAGNLILGADISSINALSNLTANLGTLNEALTATTVSLNDGVNGIGDNLTLNGKNLSLIGNVVLNDLTFNGTGANNIH